MILLLKRIVDNKGLIRSIKSKKNRQIKGQTMINKTLHRKVKTDQDEPH